jgi:hypothetical protein
MIEWSECMDVKKRCHIIVNRITFITCFFFVCHWICSCCFSFPLHFSFLHSHCTWYLVFCLSPSLQSLHSPSSEAFKFITNNLGAEHPRLISCLLTLLSSSPRSPPLPSSTAHQTVLPHPRPSRIRPLYRLQNIKGTYNSSFPSPERLPLSYSLVATLLWNLSAKFH